MAALLGHRVPGGGPLRGASRADLLALRDAAAEAKEEESASLLHELGVQQGVGARRGQPILPDPRAPYVGHLQLEQDGQVRDYLLGHATLIDVAADVRVVDWRVAPVAQLFYRYREGDAFDEELSGREFVGTVRIRRVVVFRGGKVSQLIGDGLSLTRDAQGQWTSQARQTWDLASGGSGSAAREGTLGLGVGKGERAPPTDITARLDPQQYAAVSAPPETPLLVLGSAGSGKTTVALHRLARLCATEPERFPFADCRVVVPSEGLARLSRRLLEPLGSAEARVNTLDEALRQLARFVLGRLPPLSPETPALVVSLKRHPALARALHARKVKPRPQPPGLKQLRRELAQALTNRDFLARVVDDAHGTLPRTAIEETVRHTMRQLDDSLAFTLDGVTDEERKVGLDGKGLAEDTDDELSGTLDPEDAPLLLLLLARHHRWKVPGAAHLVLDEAEDFSFAELEALAALVRERRVVTLAGDEAQQTQSSFDGWKGTLATLDVPDAVTCRLPISYRCPRPITELAQRVLGPLAAADPPRAAREGAPVGRFIFPAQAQAHLFLSGALEDLLRAEPHASVAAIFPDEERARAFHRLVAEWPEARLVLDGGFTFEPGLDVTDVESTKGLEFDYVVVVDATYEQFPPTDDARRRLHVAVTRAAHQLWLVCGGSPSPLWA